MADAHGVPSSEFCPRCHPETGCLVYRHAQPRSATSVGPGFGGRGGPGNLGYAIGAAVGLSAWFCFLFLRNHGYKVCPGRLFQLPEYSNAPSDVYPTTHSVGLDLCINCCCDRHTLRTGDRNCVTAASTKTGMEDNRSRSQRERILGPWVLHSFCQCPS